MSSSLKEVDWRGIHQDTIGWDEMKEDTHEHFALATKMCTEMKDEIAG